MDLLGYRLGYLGKHAAMLKELPSIGKVLKGSALGAALGGTISPAAAYVSGDKDDVKRSALMGVMGGAVGGATKQLSIPFLSREGTRNQLLGHAFYTVPGVGTAVAARKIHQKLEKREKQRRRDERRALREQRKLEAASEEPENDKRRYRSQAYGIN